MERNELDLLSPEQLNEYDFLSIPCKATCYACLSGVHFNDSAAGLITSYYVSSDSKSGYCSIASPQGFQREFTSYNPRVGIRPCMKVTNVSKFKKDADVDEKGNVIVEYGEYPQSMVDDELASRLEKEYNYNTLKKTGKSYTINKNRDQYASSFDPEEIDEYEFDGQKYVRITSSRDTDEYIGDRSISVGEAIWIRVEPIKWYLDERTSTIVSCSSIVGGISFSSDSNCKYEDSFVYNYLNKYMAKEMKSVKKSEVDKFVDEIEKIIEDNKDKVDDPRFKDLIVQIRSKISKLLLDYNKELDKLINTSSTILTFGIKDEDTLKRELMDKLDDYKSELLNYVLPKNKYLQLANILRLNQNSSNVNDELLSDLKQIKYVVLPELGNSNIVKEYNDFIDEEVRTLTDLSKKGDTPSLEILEIQFRSKLGPYLQKLLIAVQNKSYLNEVAQKANEGMIIESRNKGKGIYLTIYDACYEIIKKIKLYGNEIEVGLANEVELRINEAINSDIDPLEVLEIMKEYFKELNSIEYDMEGRLNRIDKINSMKSMK